MVEPLGYRYEIVVVDDGSHDTTFRRAAELGDAGFPVRARRLSRNFGKEGALLAGLTHATGDAVVTIDADLQHPSELIPDMVRAWEAGAKVVHGVKRDRGDEPWSASVRAWFVNRVITSLGGIDVRRSSDFKLLDRAAVDVLATAMPERSRFYRGLADWIGFPQDDASSLIASRKSGKSGWSVRSLIGSALTALVSFTSAPLRVISVLGVLTFLLGIAVGSDALRSWLAGEAVSGFATTIMTLLIIGSFIMINSCRFHRRGYIAKVYDELKRRPAFVIDRIHENAGRRGAQPGADADRAAEQLSRVMTSQTVETGRLPRPVEIGLFALGVTGALVGLLVDWVGLQASSGALHGSRKHMGAYRYRYHARRVRGGIAVAGGIESHSLDQGAGGDGDIRVSGSLGRAGPRDGVVVPLAVF